MSTEPDTQTPPAPIPSAQLITEMLKGRENISDLVFSPGHAPQMEISGQLVEIKFKGFEKLTPTHTQQIARDLMGSTDSPAALRLEKEGATDLSYSLPSLARFRV